MKLPILTLQQIFEKRDAVGFAFVQYIENIEIPNCRAVAKRNSLVFQKTVFRSSAVWDLLRK